MDKIPQVRFVNSPRTEAERLSFTRRVIDQGFYHRHRFVVVPELMDGVDSSAQVVYPKASEYKMLQVEKWEREWGRLNKRFWEEMEKYFPGAQEAVGSVEVRLTRFGTVSSSARMGVVAGRKEIFYLRQEADLSHLTAIIVNSLLWGERKGLGITWSKREAIMDFVMTRPVLRKMFPDYQPVMQQLARVPATIRRQSQAYLRELGIPQTATDLGVVEGKIWVNGVAAEAELTMKEHKAAKLLIENRGEIVTYDDLADKLWGEGEFKTYWALNKLIERLRKKMDKLGIAANRLKPIRGRGYLLS